jgi:hypothetical protein
MPYLYLIFIQVTFVFNSQAQVMGFLVDVFSFQKCHYTNVEELAVDLLTHLKLRVEAVSQKVSVPSNANIV